MKYLGVMPPSINPDISIGEVATTGEMTDGYIANVCVKQQGVVAIKDNEYGYRVVLGSLISELITLAAAGIDIMSLMTSMIMIIFTGMIMKIMGEKS